MLTENLDTTQDVATRAHSDGLNAFSHQLSSPRREVAPRSTSKSLSHFNVVPMSMAFTIAQELVRLYRLRDFLNREAYPDQKVVVAPFAVNTPRLVVGLSSQPRLHLAYFGLLGDNDLLREHADPRIVTIPQRHLRHLHRALVVGDH